MSTNLNKTPRTFLWLTIYNRLLSQGLNPMMWIYDTWGKWIERYPRCFPKFMRTHFFTAFYNGVKCRWEILKGNHKVMFNLNDYL